MTYYIQISTIDWPKDRVLFEDTLNTLEKLCDTQNGYILNEPVSKFGWTFFKLEFKSNFQISISEKFSDILAKYQYNDDAGKFTKFMSDYFAARGCNVKVNSIN